MLGQKSLKGESLITAVDVGQHGTHLVVGADRGQHVVVSRVERGALEPSRTGELSP